MSGILAHYDSVAKAGAAVERLRAEGHADLQVFSPVPSEELEEALGIVSSPVRRWALIGGVTGFLTALALTVLTSVAYPLVTQGKPIVSLPAFFVPIFELTILFTGLFGFAGLLVHARKPSRLSPHYRTQFSVDRFGVWVPAPAGGARSEVESLLRETGAVEVEVSG